MSHRLFLPPRVSRPETTRAIQVHRSTIGSASTLVAKVCGSSATTVIDSINRSIASTAWTPTGAGEQPIVAKYTRTYTKILPILRMNTRIIDLFHVGTRSRPPTGQLDADSPPRETALPPSDAHPSTHHPLGACCPGRDRGGLLRHLRLSPPTPDGTRKPDHQRATVLVEARRPPRRSDGGATPAAACPSANSDSLIRRRDASRNRAGGGRDRDAPEPSDVHSGAATGLWLHRQGLDHLLSRPGPR